MTRHEWHEQANANPTKECQNASHAGIAAEEDALAVSRNATLLSPEPPPDAAGPSVVAARPHLTLVPAIASELRVKHQLVVVDAVAGAGKSTLLSHIIEAYEPSEAVICPKYRTGGRPLLPGQVNHESVQVSDEAFDALEADPKFYHYQFGPDRYGLHRRDLEALIESSRNAVVVIRSARVIGELLRDNANVTTVRITTHWSKIAERVLAEKCSEEIKVRRLARIAEYLDDYDPHLYMRRIDNNGTREEFAAAIDELLAPAARKAA